MLRVSRSWKAPPPNPSKRPLVNPGKQAEHLLSYHRWKSQWSVGAAAPGVSKRGTPAKTDVPADTMTIAETEMTVEPPEDTTTMTIEDIAPPDMMMREILDGVQGVENRIVIHIGTHIGHTIYTAPAGEIPLVDGQNHQSRNAKREVARGHGSDANPVVNELQWLRLIDTCLAPAAALPSQSFEFETRTEIVEETGIGTEIGIGTEGTETETGTGTEIERAIDRKNGNHARLARPVRAEKPDNDIHEKKLIDMSPAPPADLT